jgi:D-alanyl-D-alanine carboxypeptidase
VRCINSKIQKKSVYCLFLTLVLILGLTACGNTAYEMPFGSNDSVSGFNVVKKNNSSVVPVFAENLCVINGNILSEDVDMSTATSALLCDVNKSEVLYSKNPHERLYPASLTKVMTALVAIKYGSMDQTLTATDNVNITESGAQLAGLKSGDRMTLNQALHILLINSANDVAMLIAENVGGSVENFLKMMNEEAKALGATNSNFANPHGLTDANHYTTAYDLYLIFNEAVKQEKFTEIISMSSYETSYTDKKGKTKEFSCRNTNWYLSGNAIPPENITVLGGKTGVTSAAQHCLLVYSKDTSGDPYISVILKSESRDIIYKQMSELLHKINK